MTDLPSLPAFMDGRELCAQTDPENFFPEKGGSTRPGKRVCACCPLRLPCLEYALTTPVDGIWGGTSPMERREIAHSRGLPYNWTKTSRYAGPRDGDRPDLWTEPKEPEYGSTAAMKAWANLNGWDLDRYDHIPASVRDAYEAAHEGLAS